MNEMTIETINERIEILKQNFGVEFELEDDKVYLVTPEDDMFDEGLDVESFISYTEDIENITKIDDTSVRCGKYRQTIVYEDGNKSTPYLKTDDCILSIVDKPFLIGIMAIKKGYDTEGAFSLYTAIELEYYGEKRLPDEEETILIKRYLYDVSSKLGYAIFIEKFHCWPDFTKKDETLSKYSDYALSVENIPPYNKAMDYYIEALDSVNADVRFLSFYKVLEYFSPAVSKKKYYEEMNKRLDALSVLGRTYDDVKGVFELAMRHDDSLKDNKIPLTIISNCVDLEMLSEFLPKRIQTRLKNFKKNRGISKEDGTIGKVDEKSKELADIIYFTRNRIVHAKSNFQSKGNECLEEDMDELNVFMDKLCQCLFVWNGRQPINYQLK